MWSRSRNQSIETSFWLFMPISNESLQYFLLYFSCIHCRMLNAIRFSGDQWDSYFCRMAMRDWWFKKWNIISCLAHEYEKRVVVGWEAAKGKKKKCKIQKTQNTRQAECWTESWKCVEIFHVINKRKRYS